MTNDNRWMAAMACGLMAVLSGVGDAQEQPTANPYTLAVYWWPNFHCDAFHQSKKFQGWTEWEIVKHAAPRFPGHAQPRVPLWGYRDEADPKEAARSINALANAGVGAIIFDWYRYDDQIHGGVMIERALRDGFLKAPNRQRIKFALMWANHTYIDCHPFAPGSNFGNAPVWRKGELSRAAFERHTNDAIANYFSQPNYWKIGGKPYFSIYELSNLLRGLGTVKQTRAALDGFRQRVRAAGFPGLHLNIVDWSLAPSLAMVKGQPMPGDPSRKVESERDLLDALGADEHDLVYLGASRRAGCQGGAGPLTGSGRRPRVHGGHPALGRIQHYAGCRVGRPAFLLGPPAPRAGAVAGGGGRKQPRSSHGQCAKRRASRRATTTIGAAKPCACNLSGWPPLASPSSHMLPAAGTVHPATTKAGSSSATRPNDSRSTCSRSRRVVDKHPESRRIITINSWNEWVEGSYLEPDTKTGTKCLDAIREVFGPARRGRHTDDAHCPGL